MATIHVGLIAEDQSDVDAMTNLLCKLTSKTIKVHGINARGCGAIHRKCVGWAKNLNERGCTRLILVHDLDDKSLKTLAASLTLAMKQSPIAKSAIIVPVRELGRILINDSQILEKVIQGSERSLGDGALRSDRV